MADFRIAHETEDASVRPIIAGAAGLAIGTSLIGLIIFIMFRLLATSAPSAAVNPLAIEPQVPPAPRVREDPSRELIDLRRYEDQQLSTYGWVDRQAGIVHIPIERAMELQLEWGFPTRTAAGNGNGGH
jgi:hypothetical protein